jgi:hypothetical protein
MSKIARLNGGKSRQRAKIWFAARKQNMSSCLFILAVAGLCKKQRPKHSSCRVLKIQPVGMSFMGDNERFRGEFTCPRRRRRRALGLP